MSEAIEITVSFRQVEPISLERVSPMDNIKVFVTHGSNNWSIDLSRVPAIGEYIMILDHTYKVTSVLHTPKTETAARVNVTLVS